MPSLIEPRCNSLGLSLGPDGASEEVMIERVERVGSDVRLNLLSSDGERRSALLSGDEASELEIEEGEILFVSRTI